MTPKPPHSNLGKSPRNAVARYDISIFSHFKTDFYGVKSKVGLLNWYNLNVYLAAIAIAYNIIELATASRRVASG